MSKKEITPIETPEEVKQEATAQEPEEVIEKPYTMRKLRDRDMWPLFKILSKILPDELRNAFIQVIAGEKSLRDIGMKVGMDIATMIVKNLYKVEAEVSELCADLIGVTVDELNNMEFGTTPMIIYDFYDEAKKTTFFQGAFQIYLIGEFKFMDLLYSRYASPLELMNIYLEQGRFGEFVTNIINLENKRIQETAQKENDDRLWLAYVHSMSDKTFSEWKDGLMKQKPPEDYSMTDEQVEDAKQQAKEIMKRISV